MLLLLNTVPSREKVAWTEALALRKSGAESDRRHASCASPEELSVEAQLEFPSVFCRTVAWAPL